ncbi:two-component regulator propeller domain-containing protein [Acidobacteriota bacterium]
MGLRNIKQIGFFLFLLVFILRGTGAGQHYNFKNYSIADGLAQSQVCALYQAGNGYLWIGTLGGGVSRFDGTTFENFTKKDGLPDNQVVAIFEDGKGNIWFGTYKGVSRYDGITFHSLNAENSLSRQEVRAIVEDREGVLWFGTEKGLWKYDGKDFDCFSELDGLIDDSINSMLLDRKGRMWLGTERGGITKFDGSSFTHFSLNNGKENGDVSTIFEDRVGNIWFGTQRGVYKYDGKNFRLLSVKDGLSSHVTRSIIEDKAGNLWFGTEGGGIYKFDGLVFTNITEENGLSSNVVWSLLEDREGNIWIGTYRGGLDKYSGDIFTYYSTKDGLGDDVIRAILQDRSGNFWFATYRGGVSKFDGKSLTTYTTEDGLIHNFVLTIYEDRKGNFWFGTFGGVSKFDGRTFLNITIEDGLSDSVIRAIYEDRAGNMWFGTNTSGINRYDGKIVTQLTTEHGLPDNQVTAITEDRAGIVWIGTLKGIGCYDGETFINVSEKCGFKQESIYSIVQDEADNIWFAAYGDGIVRFTPSGLGQHRPWSCSHEVFDSKDGLKDDSVVSMVFDNSGRLWLGTEKGICLFDAAEYEKTSRKIFKHYGKEEGLIGIECIHNSICKDNMGNIWIGTTKGAIKYNPGKDKSNPVAPLTHINDVRFLYGEETWRDYAAAISLKDGLPVGLKLPYDKNYLEFDFIGLSFSAPGKVKYQYKLDGFDDLWVPGSGGSYASYPNLPSGKYTFMVKACNNDGIWNREPTSFSFEIKMPFWDTYWFYACCGLLVIFFVSILVKLRLRSLEKQQKVLREKVKIATVELQKGKENVERINLELEDRVLERTEELRESEKKFRLVVENANDAIFIVQDDVVKFPNPETLEMLGYFAEELEKMPFTGFIHPEDKERVAGTPGETPQEDMFSGSYSSHFFRVINKTGKELWVERTAIPVHWEGKPAVLNFFRDMTEKKELEAQLLHAQKMEAVGTMAGGIAHDFNNLLMGILGSISLILSEIGSDYPYFTELKNVEKYIQSGATLTRQLLGFARGGKYEVTPADLNRVVKNSAEMFRRTRKEISIHGKYESHLRTVEVDRGQIEQVLVNLYVNAWQAMPDGGDIYLCTENITFSETDVLPVGLKPGHYVKISVSDTGGGMDETTKMRIFEPFFTTKEMGRGTGLGLAMVYGIVTNHGGTIQVFSNEGEGTTFTIFLPASEKEVKKGKKPKSGYTKAKGTETILLVDDEEMVREIGIKILKKFGYRVLSAGGGKEALEIYEKKKEKIAIVILDIIMPVMGGPETYDALREINPGLKVLLSSGYSIDGQAEEMLRRGCRGFIQKPFSFEELSRKIRSIIDENE